MVQTESELNKTAKRRDSFWAVTPFLIVVTVLTPATTWTEGFTNRLIATDYSENFLSWQIGETHIRRPAPPCNPQRQSCIRRNPRHDVQ